MNIRKWLGYEPPEKQSQVDYLIDDILKSYYNISKQLVKGCSLNDITELTAVITGDSNNEIYFGFVNWFNAEGKEFLVNTSKFLYKNNKELEEELDYLKFIISSESNNVDMYPSDVIGTMVDISDQLKTLLEKATVTSELQELAVS